MEKGKIIKGAFILTAANIITRLLGFFYRVYMADLIGAEGMGLYQLIVPVYMLIWSISSSGFSTTISKLTSSERAAGRNPAPVLWVSSALSMSLGLICALILHQSAGRIASYILNEPRTALSLRLISFCFPFMALGSCIRGYFFGTQNSFPPAVSQVTEQVTRMGVIFVIGSFLIPKGIEYACAAAVTGMCVGEIVSCIYVLLCYISVRKSRLPLKSLSPAVCCGIILSMVIPLTLNRLASSLLSTLENILIPSRLVMSGLSKQAAISEFGKLSGMAMPLLMFPASFLTAISITIVPAISETYESRKHRSVYTAIEKSTLFAASTGFGTAALFTALSHEISSLIYGDVSVGDILLPLGFICPFMYLNVILGGILNGLGEQRTIFINGLIGSGIALLSVLFIIPKLGIYGYAPGCLFSTLASSTLNLHRVSVKTGFKANLCSSFLKPLFSASLCAAFVIFIKPFLKSFLPLPLMTFVLATVTVIIYAALLILTGAVKVKDIKELLLPVIKK